MELTKAQLTDAVKVRYNCGCGLQTTSLAEALEHSAKTGHVMDVMGRVEVRDGRSN